MKARVMTRSAVMAVVLSGFLAGCGVSPAIMAGAPLAMPQQVNAESFKGIGEALTRAVQHKFFEKDANRNKVITPEEYGIKTPEDFVDFKRMDENGDGKIELKECLPGFWDKVNAWTKVRKTANFMFRQLDKNDDNLVSPGEAHELNFPGVDAKWTKFAGGKNKGMKKSAFADFFAELMFNGDKPLKPGAPGEPPAPPADPGTPPAPPAPPTPGK